MKARAAASIFVCAAALLGTAGVSSADVFLTQATVGNGPYYLNQANTRYVLNEDILCTGSAFVAAADNVSLDLNGKTVTFGNDAGSAQKGFANPPGYSGGTARWAESNITTFTGGQNAKVYNGTFIQGAAKSGSPSTSLINGPTVIHVSKFTEVYGCTLIVYGNNGRAVYMEGSHSIHDNVIIDRMAANGTVAVTDRHAGRAAIECIYAGENTKVYGNKIYGAPQWGVYIKDMNTQLFTGWIEVYDNEVYGAVRRTNGYAFGARQGFAGRETRVKFYNNKIYGNTRGIHLDGGSKYQVYNNYGYHQFEDDLSEWGPDASFGAHGIKVEKAKQVEIYGNDITTIGFHRAADPDSNLNGVSNPTTMNVEAVPASEIYIHDNIFTAVIQDPLAPGTPGSEFSMGQRVNHSYAAALVMQGPDGYTTCGDLRIENNIFRSNNRLIYWLYTGGNGSSGYTSCTIGPGNTFEQIGPAYSSFAALRTEDYTTGGAMAKGVMILDPTFIGSETNLQQNWNGYAGTGRVQEWFVAYSGAVQVNTPAGLPIPGVSVGAEAGNGAVTSGVTGVNGDAPLVLKAWEADDANAQSPPSITNYNPYTISAQSADTTITVSSPGWNVVLGSNVIPVAPAIPSFAIFQVYYTSPANQSTGVPKETELRLLLNEPLDSQSVVPNAITVQSGAVQIPVTVSLQGNGQELVLKPTQQLPSGGTIQVRLSGVLRTVSGKYLDGDKNGVPLEADADAYVFSFATGQ